MNEEKNSPLVKPTWCIGRQRYLAGYRTLIVALLMALSYSQLAKIHPETGVCELFLFYRRGETRCPRRKKKRPAFGGAIKPTTTIQLDIDF